MAKALRIFQPGCAEYAGGDLGMAKSQNQDEKGEIATPPENKDQDLPDFLTPDMAHTLWRREDQLVNHRLTWLGITQTIFFGGFALTVSKDSGIDRDAMLDVSWAISLMGFSTSTLTLVGVIAASIAQHIVGKKFASSTGHGGISSWTTFLGRVNSVGIALCFVVSWAYLAFFWQPIKEGPNKSDTITEESVEKKLPELCSEPTVEAED